MKIYAMTATFGKLENQTLTLQPGLNVISAPNEWGKTTWCTFLATMLYGLDTREKTTKNNLALKERYAPWSGSPMSGRIDLHWQGRDITIERWSKGRTPLGEFRAFETASGLPVAELTGSNCGETLLGVERSVFLRAGFLRLADLPVTADDALRRRLNALVTTGDESGDADALGQKLKDLKNKCRANRTTGLIPQAEGQKQELESKLAELQALQAQSQQLANEAQQLQRQISALESHKQLLAYQEAEETLVRLANAESAARQAAQQAQMLEEKCAALPTQETAHQQILKLQQLQQQQLQAREQLQALPQPPREPAAPMCFYGLDAQGAIARVQADSKQYESLQAQQKKPLPLWIPGVPVALGGAVLLMLQLWIPGILLLLLGAGLMMGYGILQSKHHQQVLAQQSQMQAIASRYGGGSPADWLAEATAYGHQQQQYQAALEQYQHQHSQVHHAIALLEQQVQEQSQGLGIPAAIAQWNGILRQQESLAEARRDAQQRMQYAQALAAMTKPVEKPQVQEVLPYSADETQQLWEQAQRQQQLLQQRMGQCQGRMDALGASAILTQQLEAVNQRLDKLTLTYNALDLALQTLQTATEDLQRRFAPRITEQAREFFSQLTGGRYDRLNLTQDLTVNAATNEDVALRGIQWRSEGTMDQLYLALRLAVAKELTPEAPLVLDDALVRFDDARHALAMELLHQQAQHKQILLFTCQSRECPA